MGADRFDPEIPKPEFRAGAPAIAALVPRPVDFGTGEPLLIEVASLFPVDATGRVLTPNPAERITLDTIADYLPQP